MGGEMTEIDIRQPRWHDRVLLIADWKIGVENCIRVHHTSFPHPFYLPGEQAKRYPVEEIKTKSGGTAKMRVVPINDLETMVEEL